MKSLIKRFTDWLNRARDEETHGAPLIFPDAPVPPEPSCFVKGLIHSMKTEPESWERKYLFNFYWVCRGVILHEGVKEPYYCPNSPLSQSDSKLLAAAIQEYLARWMKQKEEQKKDREEAEKRAPFEKLGCPDKTP